MNSGQVNSINELEINLCLPLPAPCVALAFKGSDRLVHVAPNWTCTFINSFNPHNNTISYIYRNSFQPWEKMNYHGMICEPFY